jgi:hypothetical protein
VRLGHETSTHYFQPQWDLYRFHKKCTETPYTELLFLHPVESAGHVLHSGASKSCNIDALFIMLEWARCGFHSKCVGTRYTELEFLHPLGSVGHEVHFSVSGP